LAASPGNKTGGYNKDLLAAIINTDLLSYLSDKKITKTLRIQTETVTNFISHTESIRIKNLLIEWIPFWRHPIVLLCIRMQLNMLDLLEAGMRA